MTVQAKTLVDAVTDTLENINKRSDAARDKLINTAQEFNQHLDVVETITDNLDDANRKLREMLGAMSNFPPEDKTDA